TRLPTNKLIPPTTRSTLFPYTTLFRSHDTAAGNGECWLEAFTTLVAAPVDNDTLGEAGSLVGVFRNGCTIDQVLEQNLALDFRRSEEHTSELQSRENLVCRLLLEKKKS